MRGNVVGKLVFVVKFQITRSGLAIQLDHHRKFDHAGRWKTQVAIPGILCSTSNALRIKPQLACKGVGQSIKLRFGKFHLQAMFHVHRFDSSTHVPRFFTDFVENALFIEITSFVTDSVEHQLKHFLHRLSLDIGSGERRVGNDIWRCGKSALLNTQSRILLSGLRERCDVARDVDFRLGLFRIQSGDSADTADEITKPRKRIGPIGVVPGDTDPRFVEGQARYLAWLSGLCLQTGQSHQKANTQKDRWSHLIFTSVSSCDL